MIVKNKFKEMTVTCDACSEFLDTIETSFMDAWMEAKKLGWHSVYDSDSGSYTHYCPSCIEEKKVGKTR